MARTLIQYKSYMFKNKDPVIDEIRTFVEDVYGDCGKRSLEGIEQSGGPSAACMRAWFYGKTLRPQNATVEAAGRTLGHKRIWVKKGKRK